MFTKITTIPKLYIAAYKAQLIILPIIFSLVSQGCSITIPYPPDWPMPVTEKSQGCPNISGTYYNSDVCTKHIEFLFDEIMGDQEPINKKCSFCRVKLQWGDPDKKVLLVKLQGDNTNGVEEERVLTQEKGDYSCENGKVSIKYHDVFGSVIETGHEFVAKDIFLADDGSLVMEYKVNYFLHVLVIPTGMVTASRYIRWLKVDLE